ncbi:MAG TPA: AI-2E family transporter [Spirochaetia bacterium]|nr:AI-2E family transporter [Spirochaetia bacterium]
MLKKRHILFDVSSASIFWVLFSLAIVFFLIQLLDIIALIFTAILITLAICPLVDWLEKRKIKRGLSAMIILLSFFALIVSLTVSVASPLFSQTEQFIQKLPALVEKVSPIKFDVNSFSNELVKIPNQVFKIAIGTFSGFITVFAVIVLSYYMTQEMHKLKNYFLFWSPEKGEKYNLIAEKLEVEIGHWIRGQVLLMLIVGVLSYLGYVIIGLPYAIALGVIAGILELVPNVGPTIATIPAVLVGFSISPAHGFGALIVSIVVQQLENNLIVPKVMQKTTGLNPIITLLAIMIGLKLGGPLLAVLSLPVVLSARVILSHIRLNKITSIPEIR